VGADGLILMQPATEGAFAMQYFNADGLPGTMCGNGGRCVAAFAARLGIVREAVSFLGPDGMHRAHLQAAGPGTWQVSLSLLDAAPPLAHGDHYLVHTGSPHLVVFTTGLEQAEVFEEGRKLRQSPPFRKEGINVNFTETGKDGVLFVRTYERGVEDETLSCGTGVTAAALAAWTRLGGDPRKGFRIRTRGGELKVVFRAPEKPGQPFTGIHLEGPAVHVFDGELPS